VAGLTVEVLTRNGWSDDVTVLVAHRRPKPVPVLRASLPATAASLRRLRLLVDEWSAGLDLAPDLRRALQVAAGEALTNSIEHAYPRGGAPGGDTGAVEITGRLSQRGDLHVTVADAGTWRRPEPGPSLRGRGLAIMSRLMDRLQVTDDAGGTTVELTLRAARPVVVAVPGQSPTSPLPTPPDPAADFSVEVQAPPDGGDATVVRVRGPVDAATVTRLEAALRTATRGGVLPVAVDLSEVTLLSSVGVRALMGVRGQVTAHGQRLRIVAPPRSMARDALDLVGVDVDDVALTHP
jgi:anti-anti-sigma factor